jgi:lipoprotein-anchoring transpeptidase ErfK/SrfK
MALIATAVFIRVAVFSDAGADPVVRKARPAAAPEAVVAPVPGPTGLVFDHPESSLVAHAGPAKVPIYESPGAAKASKTLRNPTMEGMPLIFAVRERQDDWIKVQLPVRPNEATGWVKASDVNIKSVSTHIVVEVEKRKLSAFRGSELLMEAPVGVGTSRTPTPIGTFYVDFSVKNPGPGYGRHMLSVAGFSNVLKNFGGGVGQIAIHGTSKLDSVGAFSSNGCLRMTNDDVVRLAEFVPAGSPVFVLP